MRKIYRNKLPKGLEPFYSTVYFENGEVVVNVEFKDIYIPKFGDIVRVNTSNKGSRRNYMICIMPNGYVPDYYISGFFNIANIDMGGILSYECAFNKNDVIVPASESEKQELFDKLEKKGKCWNEGTKQLEDIRWRANERDCFYYVNESSNVIKLQDCRGFVSTKLYKENNYFRTPESAQKVADQIKEIFKNSKAE